MRTVRMSVVGAVGSVAVLVVALVVPSPQSVMAQGDPFVATWVLNVAKSKYSPGPPPKEQVSVWTAAGQGYKYMVKGTNADGSAVATEATIAFDGKDHPATGNAAYDAVASKRVDSHTIEMTRKKAGKVVQTATAVVSADGKTRTVTTTGVNAQGQKISDVAVYDKK